MTAAYQKMASEGNENSTECGNLLDIAGFIIVWHQLIEAVFSHLNWQQNNCFQVCTW